MLKRSFALVGLLAMLITTVSPTLSQTVAEKPSSDKKRDEEKLREKAVAFLRETMSEIDNLRSLENRISFASELAGLMWYHDENEARGMFAGVITDFRELLGKFDAQMAALVPEEEPDLTGGGFLFREVTDKARLTRRFSIAMGVRQQIATSIAKHDADLAFAFYFDSLGVVGNPELRKLAESRDQYFENRLIVQIIEKSPEKALKFAKRSVENGFDYAHVQTLEKLYAKNPDAAAELGSAILSQLKREKTDKVPMWALSSLISFGARTLSKSGAEGGRKAVYSNSDLRELADILGRAVLAGDGEGSEYVDLVEAYSPGRAVQIRAKFKLTKSGARSTNSAAIRSAATNASFVGATGGDEYAVVSSNATVGRQVEAQQKREQAEREMYEKVTNVGTKQLPKEEREKIVASARKIIAATPGRDKRITALSMLAAEVARSGDKELAAEIMKDAASMVNPAPKTGQDFLLSWMLASGYAAADPEKAFTLLDDVIGRANDTIEAFVKVGEFIDVAEEIIQNGEVQVGAFGGSVARELAGPVTMADATIRLLSHADFDKTKSLTNRFERPEVRALAKMLVIRAILGPEAKPKVETETVVESTGKSVDEPW